jgi:LacI family transcriptional regulator
VLPFGTNIWGIQNMGVRLKDLAEALGLSLSTVSAALHNRADINEFTRKRVLRKAKELNYYPNRLAHGLATRKTHVLGIVVPNLSRPFFPYVFEGIDTITYPAGYTFLVFNTDDDPVREQTGITTLISSQVDGLIIASAQSPRKNNSWKELRASGVPFVMMDRFFAGVPFVGADDNLIGFRATRHLITEGYRSIAHLSARDVATGRGRYLGYVRALRSAGLAVRRNYVIDVRWKDMHEGYEATKILLRSRTLPDSIFAVNDLVAIGAMKAIKESGLSIPGDIGLIGVGNVRYGDCLSVPLSTLDLHPKKVGKAAASMLLSHLQGEAFPSKPVFLDPELIIRDSSRRSSTTNLHRAKSMEITRFLEKRSVVAK